MTDGILKTAKPKKRSVGGMYLKDIRRKEEEEADANSYLKEALVQHKSEGLLLAIQARWVALAIIAVLLPFVNPTIEVIYYELLLAGFAVIGWGQLRVGRVGRSGAELALIFADLILMTVTFVAPSPFTSDTWPTAMQYQISNFTYFYVLLASAAMAYSWRTLASYGLWVAVSWLIAAVLVMFLGKEVTGLTESVSAAIGHDKQMLEFIDPNRINFGARVQEVVIFIIVSSTLALNGWRTNRLLRRQAEVARERANLARHFAPSIVDQMAAQNQPLSEVRSQDVAVMFADIVGFTGLSERQPPEEIMSLLRDFHAHMEAAVFDHQGTLHKFLGDGIMATFGTPEPGPNDAANALACARDMLARMDSWNKEREAADLEAVNLSIGIHYGNVILGDIGSERLLEFAVIGDAVNVASRLEELTRDLGTRLVVSDTLVEAIKAAPGPDNAQLSSLTATTALSLRGRDDPVSVWTHPG